MRAQFAQLAGLALLAALGAACGGDEPTGGATRADTTDPDTGASDSGIGEGDDPDTNPGDLDAAETAPDLPVSDPGGLPDGPPDARLDLFEEPLLEGDGINLEILPLDIWAQPLPDALLLWTAPGARPVALTDRPTSRLRLPDGEGGRYEIHLSAPDHEDLEVALEWDGSDPDSVVLDRSGLSGREGVSLVRRQEAVDGVRESTVTLVLGLRHRWFASSGRPARRGNRVELLMDGEQAWQRVHDRLVLATDTAHASTWWWSSDFELVRPFDTHMGLTDEERRLNTIDSLLEALPGTTRVLVWQDNLLPSITIDTALQAHAATPDDGFEFMGHTNSTEGVFWWEIAPFTFADRVRTAVPALARHRFDDEAPITATVAGREVDLTDWPLGISLEIQLASWHQKFLVIDGDEAFIGGMNFRPTDWDTSDHLVYDWRRMEFGASLRERMDVAAGEAEPDNGPRKDYMVYLQGPSVQDAEDVFHDRWRHQLDIERQYSENATDYAVRRDQQPFADGVPVQVTATMPDPFWEASILESQVNAVGNAERYIYIEDQYWRAPILNEAIIARMDEIPDLVLIVVTKPVSEWTDPGCEWTHRTHQELLERFPGRYFLYQLRAFDTQVTWGFDETESRFVDIDVHSKMLIVDDVFVSVGSCNKNNRGFMYEGELNVAVLDAAFATSARNRIVSNMLGYELDTDDPWAVVDALEAEAAYNDDVWARWDDEGFDISLDGDPLPEKYQPFGFVYSLTFRTPDDCLIEGIGPDITK